MCELLTITSDSPIRSTFHYPLSGVGRHEDKEGSRARVETNSKKHRRGFNMANSFVARLISLAARSEIRYEGIWYTVDSENDNIALRNGVLLKNFELELLFVFSRVTLEVLTRETMDGKMLEFVARLLFLFALEAGVWSKLGFQFYYSWNILYWDKGFVWIMGGCN